MLLLPVFTLINPFRVIQKSVNIVRRDYKEKLITKQQQQKNNARKQTILKKARYRK